MRYFFLFASFIALFTFSCKKQSNDVTNGNTSPSTKDKKIALKDQEFKVAESLNLMYFNDLAVGVIEQTNTSLKLITAAGVSTIILEGTDIKNMTRARTVLNPRGGNFIDANYIGVSSTIRGRSGTIYGLYHAEWHDGSVLAGGIPGFYASIGLAKSTDNGNTFIPSNAAVIPSYYDKNYNNGAADGGLGEPTMLYNKDSTKVYAYFVDHNRTGLGVNISMASFDVINGEPDFTKCYLINYNNEFVNQLIRSKHIVYGNGADAIFPQVTFNKALNKYLMVYTLNAYQEFSTGNLKDSGTYVVTSSDGINWDMENQYRIITDFAIPIGTGNSYTWHPSIFYPNASHTEGYLLYSKGQFGINHVMYARRFVIE